MNKFFQNVGYLIGLALGAGLIILTLPILFVGLLVLLGIYILITPVLILVVFIEAIQRDIKNRKGENENEK